MKADLSEPGKILSLARLRAIGAVAEEGSFVGAARRLGLSHSAVSQQIREFEAAQGITLFERLRGRLHPTPVCQELTEVGARVLEAERDAARILQRRDPSGKHRLRVGLGNSMPGIAIAGRMARNHPSVSITVESGSHQDIMAAVLRREVDVAVLPDVPADPRFRRFSVLEQVVVAIVGPDSPYASREEARLAELAQEPLIFRSRGSSTQKVVDRAFRQANLQPEPRLTADTRDAVYEAVAVGLGVGFMWRHGTGRADLVHRIALPDLGSTAEEVVFALADERNPLVDQFFVAAEETRESHVQGRAPSAEAAPVQRTAG